MSIKPFFSIVIPALNEEKYLPLLLSDLATQSWHDFEVLVIDGNSDDGTVKTALTFTKKMSLTVETAAQRNVSFQRNLGAKKALGEWIIFMDADNRIPSYFLLGIKYQLEKKPSIRVFTCAIDSRAYTIKDKPLIDFSNMFMEMYTKINPVATGALIGTHESVLQNTHFDEKITLAEDHDFVIRAQKAGFPLEFFGEPAFTYSLRRFQRDGTLTTLRSYSKAHLHLLLGKKTTQPLKEYPMEGGGYYELEKSPFFSRLKSEVAALSAKQYEQIKRYLLETNKHE